MKVANMYSKDIDVDAATDYAVKGITRVTNKIGPRQPGSPEEYAAQKMMVEDLDGVIDSTETEKFTVHRHGFMGFLPFTVVCAVSSVFVNWFLSPLAGFILSVLGMIPLIIEFLLYKEFDDFLFPKQTSHNVTVRRAPGGKVNKRLILVAHADSQYEWNVNLRLGGEKTKVYVMIPAIVALVLDIVFALVCFFAGDGLATCKITDNRWFFIIFFAVCILFIPAQLAFLFFQSWKKSIPGVSDNLSGCYVAIGAMKALADAKVRLNDTELVTIFTGSEEAGLRGAKAYVKRHLQELNEIPTAVIALDTFQDLGSMAVYERDMSGTIQNSPQVNTLLKKAGQNCDYDLPLASVYIGACDGAAFTQKKVPATDFVAMDTTPWDFYHTRYDNLENMREDAINAGIEIITEAVCIFDRDGI